LPHSYRAGGVAKVQSQSMYEHLLRRCRARRTSKAREDGSAHEVCLERVQIAFGNSRHETRLCPINLIPHYLGRIDRVCTYCRGLHWSDERLKHSSN
jgi:hypothetical protein